ncbi:MAG: cupin domain-containing protein [Verrucomicrobiae bacterium]|nr:cupin domain-containing protein [Verrucomicrobiae bacterium]
MNCTRLQELAAGYALGALDRTDAARLEALADSDPEIRMEVDAFLAVVSTLLRHLAPVSPPARLREQVLARIRRTPQRPAPAQSPSPPAPAPPLSGFRFLRPAEGAWTEGLHPGTRFQVLSSDVRRRYMILIIELDPGAIYPGHDHRGAEELYLIRGDLLTEGRLMRAGDYLHSDSGTHHQDLTSPSGCQALLIAPLSSALLEAAKIGLKRTGEKVKSDLGLGGS